MVLGCGNASAASPLRMPLVRSQVVVSAFSPVPKRAWPSMLRNKGGRACEDARFDLSPGVSKSACARKT